MAKNKKKLFIPRKTASKTTAIVQPTYNIDCLAIQNFINTTLTLTPGTTGVTQILPGTGITVTPSTGKGIVTINATGSGGSVTSAYYTVHAPFNGSTFTTPSIHHAGPNPLTWKKTGSTRIVAEHLTTTTLTLLLVTGWAYYTVAFSWTGIPPLTATLTLTISTGVGSPYSTYGTSNISITPGTTNYRITVPISRPTFTGSQIKIQTPSVNGGTLSGISGSVTIRTVCLLS